MAQALLNGLGIRQCQFSHSHLESQGWEGLQVTPPETERALVYNQFICGRVCATCNNGWMSGLERGFLPLHERLSQSQQSNWQPSQADRMLLSKWALKTALVLSATVQPAVGAVPDNHAREFYNSERLNFPSSFIIVSAQSAELIPGFRFSFCSTWMFETQSHSVDAIQHAHSGAYKVYLHLGNLMILVCHVRALEVEFLIDTRYAIEVVSTASRIDPTFELPATLPHPSEPFQFAMSVGARLL